MILINKMKNFKIYRTQTFLPTPLDNKKKNSAILLLTPNYLSSRKLMNNDLFVNKKRYISYYIERDIAYYINTDKKLSTIDDEKIVEERAELSAYMETKRSELPDDAFGIPGKRKFPLDTKAHVRSAIKFFNYAEPEDEAELSKNIIKDMDKFNITDVKVSKKNRFSKYYQGSIEESVEYLDESTSLDYNNMRYCFPEALDMGDKLLMFTEASSNTQDMQLRRILFNQRMRKRKDVLNLYDQVKKDNPWIQFTFPDMKKYIHRNLFVDLYFYNNIFFMNNKWVQKRGLELYQVFMDRLINHPNLKSNGYTNKTIFIPIKDWDLLHNTTLWNYRMNINPMSIIYEMMRQNKLTTLRKTFQGVNVVFVGEHEFFKVNFDDIDPKQCVQLSMKFRNFLVKICKNEPFDASDIDTEPENREDSEVLQRKIIDKVEDSKGVDLSAQVAASVTAKKQAKKEDPVKAAKENNPKSRPAVRNTEADKKAEEKKKREEQQKQNLSKAAMNKPDDHSKDENEAKKKKLADKIVDATEDETSEEDAMDNMDADKETKELLMSVDADDGRPKINKARSARMNDLNNKLMEKQVNGKSVKEILEDKENEEAKKNAKTTINVASPNQDEWSGLTFMNFDKHYSIDKDIINCFRKFSEVTYPIAITDIKIEDNSTTEDHINLYTVRMEDFRGKRFTVKLDIPIMEDNRFLLRGNFKSIQIQSFNMPIIKTDTGACQLISNYQKIFLYRFGSTPGKSLPITARILKVLNTYKGTELKVKSGDSRKVSNKYHLPIDYVDMGSAIATIETKNHVFYFNQDEIANLYKVDYTYGIPYAHNKKDNTIEYFTGSNGEMFVETLFTKIVEDFPRFSDLYAKVTRPSVSMYTQISIMNSKMPLILVMGLYIGLQATLKRSGINFSIVQNLTQDIRKDFYKDWIKFSDGYIVYDVTYDSSLLMNGLKALPTEAHSLSEIDNKYLYIEFLDNFGGRVKADGLENFRDLFVDPMTKETLEYYHFPTDFIDMLICGNSLMGDNKFIKHTDVSSRRLRRYQLIAVYTYKVLSAAYNYYAYTVKKSRNTEFSVKQSAVIDEFLKDSITSDDSVIDALRDVETTNAVTNKGPSGMNSSRAYSIDKRTYDDSMVNVLGMSTGFAGNVGIVRQATINSNVDENGYVIPSDGDTTKMNDANTLTATEALIPMSSTHDDPMRTAMSFIQTSKHAVRTQDSDPLLVTSGFDEVMPYMTTNRFAYKAKGNGKILEVTDKYILVEYADGKKDYISLEDSTEKNSDGGYYESLKLSAADGIKEGMTFKEGQIIAYDKLSFSNRVGESDNIAYNVGKLAKIAIINSDEGFEDSGIISASMAKKLATKIQLKFECVIDNDSRIVSMAKLGDHIEASQNLLVWEDAFDDEESNAVVASLIGDDSTDLGKRTLKSEVTGELKTIRIYRTTELDEMSPSVRAVVEAYEAPIIKKEKFMRKNGIVPVGLPPHTVLPPTGKLKKSQNAIYVEFYVEYLDTVGVGDKVVYNAANKAVEKNIFPKGKEPYTAFRPEEKIDAMVSETSIDHRMVSSTLTYGSLQKLMIELDRSVKDIMGIPYDHTQV